jgi:Mg-chelatase subunit ChlD
VWGDDKHTLDRQQPDAIARIRDAQLRTGRATARRALSEWRALLGATPYDPRMRWALIVGLVVALAGAAEAKDGAPSNLIVVVDASMQVEKLGLVEEALIAAVSHVDAADRIAVIAAGRAPTTAVAFQPVGDGKRVAAGIARGIDWTDRGDLAAGVRAAAAVVAGLDAQQRRGDIRVIVITNAETPSIEKQVAGLARAGAQVWAMSYQSENGSALDAIARGGGKAFAATTKTDLVEALVAQSSNGTAPLAVVLVIDRSGSMRGAKLEAAKESARVTAEVLDPNDTLAVVAFDSEATVVVRPQRASNKMRISADIARLTDGGGTNIYPALNEAFGLLRGMTGVRKHVILLTDGDAPADGIEQLVTDMHRVSIEVTAVGLGAADRNLLSMIAEAGGGRLYMVEDLGSLPRIFMKETAWKRR